MVQPGMMAIGDSLFNGVRSLTINQQLAQWSAPAQVARALGIPFAIPDYPRNVIVNFEQWLREFPNLIGIAADVEGNINFWDTNPKSSLPEFDNIAIASTRYADLWTRTAQVAQTEIDALSGILWGLSAYKFPINGPFLAQYKHTQPGHPVAMSRLMLESAKRASLVENLRSLRGLGKMRVR